MDNKSVIHPFKNIACEVAIENPEERRIITQMKQSVTTGNIVNHMFWLALRVVRITNDPHF